MTKAVKAYATTRWGRITLTLVTVAAALLLPSSPIMRQIDDMLTALRFEYAPRAATKKVVFVAIDKRSLDAVGVWPWPRSVHARLLDRLVADGASDIFFDIDFSTPSDPADDARFAKALSDAGGGVILPIFQQRDGVGAQDQVSLTRPIKQFADNAWPASVNVPLDADGLVRRFDWGGSRTVRPVNPFKARWQDPNLRRGFYRSISLSSRRPSLHSLFRIFSPGGSIAPISRVARWLSALTQRN